MRKIAIDAGCAYIKIACYDNNNRITTFAIPSIVSDEKPMSDLNGNKTPSYRCEGRQLSIIESSTRYEDTRLPDYPYSSVNTVLMHHGLIRAGIRNPEIQLSTSIPLHDYFFKMHESKKRKRDSVQRAISADAGLMLPTIEHKLTLPEGLAGWIDMCFDKEGKKKPNIPTGEVGLVDIGGRTTDIAVVNGMAISTDSIDTVKMGYLDVMDHLNEELNIRFSDSGRFAISSLDKALHTRQIEIESGRVEDISEEVEKVLHAFSDRTLQEVNRILGNRGQLSGTCYFGGGVEHIRDIIMQQPKVFIPEQPQFSNVIGCLKAFRADLSA